MQLQIDKIRIEEQKNNEFSPNPPEGVAGFAPFVRGNSPKHIVARVREEVQQGEYVWIQNTQDFNKQITQVLAKGRIMISGEMLLVHTGLSFVECLRDIRKEWANTQHTLPFEPLFIAVELNEAAAHALAFVLSAEVNELYCKNMELLRYRYMVEPTCVDVFF